MQGLLGKAMSTANSNITVCTIGSTATFATVTIDAVNTDTVDAEGDIFITSNSGPSDIDKVDHVVIPPNGKLEISCKLLSPNEKVIVNFNSNKVAVRVSGLENIPV